MICSLLLLANVANVSILKLVHDDYVARVRLVFSLKINNAIHHIHASIHFILTRIMPVHNMYIQNAHAHTHTHTHKTFASKPYTNTNKIYAPYNKGKHKKNVHITNVRAHTPKIIHIHMHTHTQKYIRSLSLFLSPSLTHIHIHIKTCTIPAGSGQSRCVRVRATAATSTCS